MSEIKGLTELEELFVNYGLYEEECEFTAKDTEYKIKEIITLNKLQYMTESVGYIEVIKSRLINPYNNSIRLTSAIESNIIRSVMYVSGVLINGQMMKIPMSYRYVPVNHIEVPIGNQFGFKSITLNTGEGMRQHMLTSPDLKLYMRDHKELLIDNLRNDLLKHEDETLERIGYNEIQSI